MTAGGSSIPRERLAWLEILTTPTTAAIVATLCE
jgi:hypothetical protein